MKPDHEAESDERFDKMLRTWKVDVPLPPRFQELVWQRLARAESSTEATTTLWAGLLHWLEIALPRPRVALSYAAVLLAMGLLGGALAAQIQSSRLDAALGARYVQSVDPYQTVSFGR